MELLDRKKKGGQEKIILVQGQFNLSLSIPPKEVLNEED